MLEPLESQKEEHYRSGPPSYEYSSMEVLSFFFIHMSTSVMLQVM